MTLQKAGILKSNWTADSSKYTTLVPGGQFNVNCNEYFQARQTICQDYWGLLQFAMANLEAEDHRHWKRTCVGQSLGKIQIQEFKFCWSIMILSDEWRKLKQKYSTKNRGSEDLTTVAILPANAVE